MRTLSKGTSATRLQGHIFQVQGSVELHQRERGVDTCHLGAGVVSVHKVQGCDRAGGVDGRITSVEYLTARDGLLLLRRCVLDSAFVSVGTLKYVHCGLWCVNDVYVCVYMDVCVCECRYMYVSI
jgi:hypothetical protein